MSSVPPPSEPDWRFSRIRLSGWWFTSSRIDALGRWLFQVRTTPAPQSRHLASVYGHFPPLTPSSRALNIRAVHTVGSTHDHRSWLSPACLALGTVAGLSSFGLSFTSPPSCAPFAPPQLRGFFATMGALTPVRPVLRPIHAFALYRMNSGTARTGLPDSARWPS